MRRTFVALALLLFAACGRDGSSAERALSETADGLTSIRRGELHLRVTAATLADAGSEVGFDVRGPFALSEAEGRLPQVRFAYTDLLGGRSETTTFVSTGDRAFVERDGRTVPVPDDALVSFRGKADPEKATALGALKLDEWARSPKQVSPDRIVAEVDAAKALNDVFGVAASVGAADGSFPRVEGKDAERLQEAVRSSRLEVDTVGEDRMLRSLRLVIDFAPEDRADLERLLGRFGGARLSVLLELAKVHQAP